MNITNNNLVSGDYMYNYNDLEKYDYIFLDVFDGLFIEKNSSDYINKIWCNYLIKYFNLNLSMVYLYKLRLKALKKYFSESDFNAVNYNDSYSNVIKYIYNHLNDIQKFISYDSFYKICMDLEFNIIKESFHLDVELVSVLRKLKSNGKKIYFVSNVCLSRIMFDEIILFYGVNDLFDGFFVSFGLSFNKKNNFVKLLCKYLNILDENYIVLSSKTNANCLNLCHIDGQNVFLSYNNNFKEIYKNFKVLFSSSTDNFEHVIFSLYTFIEKLYFSLLRQNVNEVVFLSREGEFLKKLFDIYVSNINNKRIVSKYMIVSRKATYLPSLESIDKEKFSFLFEQYSCMSCVDFFKSLNFSKQEILEIQKSLELVDSSLDVNTVISNFSNSNVFKIILNDKKFIDIYESNRISQKNNITRYIKNIVSSNNFCVVDIGWNGSIQTNIQKILGDSFCVLGYYFGLEKRDNKVDESKYGLMFSNVPYYTRGYKLYNVNRAIYEILLGASHGSANKYVLKDNDIIVDLFFKEEEALIYNNVISNIQDNMSILFGNLCLLFNNGFYDNKKYYKLFNKVHFDMMFNPSKKQMEFINEVYHYENFGVFKFTTFGNKKKDGYGYKLYEYKQFFLNFNDYFNDTAWPLIKLYNNDMKFALLLYRNLKKVQFYKDKIL